MEKRLLKVLQTSEDENVLREVNLMVSNEIVSAAKYYIGKPDGKYFTSEFFDESVVNAKKAYETLNTLMGGDTAEKDRFYEGKKQVSGLLTPLGVRKIIELFEHLYYFALENNGSIDFSNLQTVRACRQSEMKVGESIVSSLNSTTKLSIDEIMKFGYGNKNGLAICSFKFHPGVAICDMEKFGDDYLKPEEREVLILMGNRLITRCLGYNENYLGKDNKPALMYEVEVYPPTFDVINENYDELEKVVFNEQYINEIRIFFSKLNNFDNGFPKIPTCYRTWKECFKKLVFLEIEKLYNI